MSVSQPVSEPGRQLLSELASQLASQARHTVVSLGLGALSLML